MNFFFLSRTKENHAQFGRKPQERLTERETPLARCGLSPPFFFRDSLFVMSSMTYREKEKNFENGPD